MEPGPAGFLRVNPDIVAEAFDGEVVLIDIARGLYFSLCGAAVELWQAFADPRTADEVLRGLAPQAEGDHSAAMHDAIQSMHANELIVDVDAPVSPSAPLVAGAAASVTPVVQVFSDLADLIAIDPVHEVDAGAGWPMRPANFPDVA